MHTFKMILVMVSVAGLIASSGCAHKSTSKTTKTPSKEAVAAKPATNAPTAKVTTPVKTQPQAQQSSPAPAPKAPTVTDDTAAKASPKTPAAKVTASSKAPPQAPKSSIAPVRKTQSVKAADTKVATETKAKTAVTSPAPAPKQTQKAIASKPAPKTVAVKSDKPAIEPAQMAQPVKVPVTKEERLAALLEQYKADKISAREYHQSRAKIVAEP